MAQDKHMKIGTDICSVQRIKNTYEKYGQRFLDRVLTSEERNYLENKSTENSTLKNSRLSEVLAGRFAAKEAVAKALGSRRIGWKEVEIINAESGAPPSHPLRQSKKIIFSAWF